MNVFYIFLKGVYFAHFRFYENKRPLCIGLKREGIFRKYILYHSIKRVFDDLLGAMLFWSYLFI